MSSQLPPPPPAYSYAPIVSERAGNLAVAESSRPAPGLTYDSDFGMRLLPASEPVTYPSKPSKATAPPPPPPPPSHELHRAEWVPDYGPMRASQTTSYPPEPAPPKPSRMYEPTYGAAGPQQPLHPLYYSELDPHAAPAHIVYTPKSLPHYAPVEPGPYRLPEISAALPPAPSRRSTGVSPGESSQSRTHKKITQRREPSDPSHRGGRHASRKSVDDRQIEESAVILKHEESARKPSVAAMPPAYPPQPSYHGHSIPQPETMLIKKSRESLSQSKSSADLPPTDLGRSRHPMSISGLITSDEAPVVQGVPSDEISISRSAKIPPFRMIMRQQPIAARACGFGERDRRVIDPPPILQVFAKSRLTGADDEDPEYWPASVVHCSLWHADEDRDDTIMPESSDRKQQRRLMGTLVSSPFIGLDENGVEGCFFTFPDLSCRTSGRYRLRMVLTCIEPNVMQNFRLPFRSVVVSDIFCVYAAKDFPGMRTSTLLTKKLKDQGCLISVKKGSDKTDKPRKKKSKSHTNAGSGSEDNSDADSETSTDEEGGETSAKKSRSRPVKKKAKQVKV